MIATLFPNNILPIPPMDDYLYFFVSDGSKSLLVIISKQNTLYTPYGSAISGGEESRYDYEGKEFDSVTEDYDFHFRKQGIAGTPPFQQPDTLLPNVYDPQKLNRYAFERGNPLKNKDETGHDFGITGGIILTVFFSLLIVGLIFHIREGGKIPGGGNDLHGSGVTGNPEYQKIMQEQIAKPYLKNGDSGDVVTAKEVLEITDSISDNANPSSEVLTIENEPEPKTVTLIIEFDLEKEYEERGLTKPNKDMEENDVFPQSLDSEEEEKLTTEKSKSKIERIKSGDIKVEGCVTYCEMVDGKRVCTQYGAGC